MHCGVPLPIPGPYRYRMMRKDREMSVADIVFRLRFVLGSPRYFIEFALNIVKEVTASMQPAIQLFFARVSNRQQAAQAVNVCRHRDVCVCVHVQ